MNSDRPEGPTQPVSDLSAQSTGGSNIRNPAAGVTELIESLENVELRQGRLAAGCWHVDHDRGLGWIREALLQQRCALRGQEFKHRLMLAPRQGTHEVRGHGIHPSQDRPQGASSHDPRRCIQVAQEDLQFGVRDRSGRPDPGLEVLVEFDARIRRIALQEVASEDFSSLRPVVQGDQAQRNDPVLGFGTRLKLLLFVGLLIVTQADDRFAHTIEVAPALLAEQPYPAVDEAIQHLGIPRRTSCTGNLQGFLPQTEPAPEVRPAVAAVCQGGQTQHGENPARRFRRDRQETPKVKRLMRSSHGLLAETLGGRA